MKITEKKNLQYCTKVSCASNKRDLLVIFLSDKNQTNKTKLSTADKQYHKVMSLTNRKESNKGLTQDLRDASVLH